MLYSVNQGLGIRGWGLVKGYYQPPTPNTYPPPFLPTRFHNARNLSLQRQLAEADATQVELAQVCARSPATLAARVSARRELRFPVRFRNQ